MQLIGEAVLFHRKQAGLSREACAQLAGVGKTAVFDIEHGKASVQLDTLLKVLNVVNIQLRLDSPIMEKMNHEKS